MSRQLTKAQARRILQEQAIRANKKQIKWLDGRFKAQNNFVLDPSPLKAAQCTRRAAKSYSAGIMLLKAATETPNCTVLYVTKTRETAKRILFNPVLKELDRKHNLNADFNKSDLSVTLTNGSVVYLLGIDNSEEEAEKLLGQKYKLVIIDEAAFIQKDLHKLVYEVLKPAVADYNGQIVMISTTSDYTSSFYYKVMEENYPGWSRHKWTTYDNPFMVKQWTKEIKELKKNHPDIETTPFYRRMYLNEWVIDTINTIYKYTSNNIINTLPSNITNYVLGIDLGYDDSTAFAVIGYNSNNLYILDVFKQSKMLLTDVADKIKEYESQYHFDKIIIDGAVKQAVETMKQSYGLNLTYAEKHGKKEHIELLNAELAKSKVKVYRPHCEPLLDEWGNLVWDARQKEKGKWVEHAACENHLSDAVLYGWRYCYTYFFNDSMKEETIKVIDPLSEQAVNDFWAREEQKILRRQQNQEGDWLLQEVDDYY